MLDKKKPVNEDFTLTQNKWNSEVANRDMKPTVMTLFDLVKAYDKIKDTNHKAPIVLPQPMQFLTEDLGELYISTVEIAAKIKEAGMNPIIGTNKAALIAAREALKCTVEIRKQIKRMARHLDGAVIDKSAENDK
jgi:predicted lipid-binding transport protein (Tim44 family)